MKIADDICATGKTCVEGTCVEIPECNGVVHDGGNFGEKVPIEMGKSEGRGSFSMITYYAEDRMTLRDANGKVIFETPCIGTSRLADLEDDCLAGGLDIRSNCVMDNGVKCFFHQGVDYRKCLFTDGWKCHLDTGECSRPFEYSGGSVLTVEVTPNCGTTTDTVWGFSVSCP